jgi:hypothetical protein
MIIIMFMCGNVAFRQQSRYLCDDDREGPLRDGRPLNKIIHKNWRRNSRIGLAENFTTCIYGASLATKDKISTGLRVHQESKECK